MLHWTERVQISWILISLNGLFPHGSEMFFMTMNVSFNAVQNVILIFPDWRPVFLSEVNNNMYKCSPYLWAKVISEMPLSIMMPTVFGCIVYFSVGLNPATGFNFLFLLIPVFVIQCFEWLLISRQRNLQWQATHSNPDARIDYSLYAFRRSVRRSNQHPCVAERVRVLVYFKYS